MIAVFAACAALGISVVALVITIKNKKKPDIYIRPHEEPMLPNDQLKREVELQKNYEKYMEESAKFIFRVSLEKAYLDLSQKKE